MQYILVLFAGVILLNLVFGRKYNRICLAATVCAFGVLAFFVVPTKNMDLYRYINVMELYRDVGWLWVLKNDTGSNPLAAVFFYAASLVDDNRFLPMITVLLTYGFSIALLYKAKKDFGAKHADMMLALVFFLLNFNLCYVIDVVRIYICFAVMAFFLYVDIVEKKHRWLCWIVYLALCYVHYAMLVFVLIRLYFAVTRKLKGLFMAISMLLLPVLLRVGYSMIIRFDGSSSVLLGTMSDKAQGYMDYDVFGIWQFLASICHLMFFTLLCVLMLWCCVSAHQKTVPYSARETDCDCKRLNIGRTRDMVVFCLYIIFTVLTFADNYQFLLRTTYFILILMAPMLLALLTKLHNMNRPYRLNMFVLIALESLLYFGYLIVYVYTVLTFSFS